MKIPEPVSTCWRLIVITAAAACMATASAAEKTYRYFRFETTRVWNGNPSMQMAEFTFSRNGTVLNTNNRNGSGVSAMPVTITSGAQNPTENEGPTKVGDGNLGTKWYKGTPFGEGQALTLFDSRAIGHDADVVLIVEKEGIIRGDKMRNGLRDQGFRLRLDGVYQRFVEWDEAKH